MSGQKDRHDVAHGCGLVGREGELARLDDAVDRARAGSPTVVLVVGEPGVGKTRLVQAGFERSGAVVVSATADPSEAELDYGLLEQLLRSSPLGGDTVDDLTPKPGTDPLAAGPRSCGSSTASNSTARWPWSSTTPTGPTAAPWMPSPSSRAGCEPTARCCA